MNLSFDQIVFIFIEVKLLLPLFLGKYKQCLRIYGMAPNMHKQKSFSSLGLL